MLVCRCPRSVRGKGNLSDRSRRGIRQLTNAWQPSRTRGELRKCPQPSDRPASPRGQFLSRIRLTLMSGQYLAREPPSGTLRRSARTRDSGAVALWAEGPTLVLAWSLETTSSCKITRWFTSLPGWATGFLLDRPPY